MVDEAAATIKTEINYEPEELEKVKQLVTRLNMEKIALNEEDKEKHKNRIRELEDEIKSANQKISKLQNKWNEEKNELEDLSKLKKYLDDLWYKINIYKRETKYEDASRLEYSEVPKIEKKIKELEEKISFSDSTLIKNSVTAEEIAGIVSKWTMIPVTKLLETDKQKLLNLENELRARIKGQDEAVNLVSKAVLRAKANINDPNRPLSKFSIHWLNGSW
nr:hypothetical protein [Mycoplasmopsis bovis]